MGVRATGGKLLFMFYFMVLGSAAGTAFAETGTQRRPPSVFYDPNIMLLSRPGSFTTQQRSARHYNSRYAALSCVPYARAHSNVRVAGNAWQWWANAAGIYERGNLPELDGVLVFQSNRQMHLGHVAVVSRVLNPRMIEIDQSNWPNGHGITRRVPVVDVSERNDWTAVRVALGQSSKFGSIYPTYGFIYGRPDTGRLVASNWAPTPVPPLDPAPGDLRTPHGDEQVAQAPALHQATRPRRPGAWASSARRGSKG